MVIFKSEMCLLLKDYVTVKSFQMIENFGSFRRIAHTTYFNVFLLLLLRLWSAVWSYWRVKIQMSESVDVKLLLV